MKIDFSNVDSTAQEFTPIEEGRYNMEVISAKEKQSSTGKPMISAQLKVLDAGQWKDRYAFTNFILTEKSYWNLKGFLDAVSSPFAETGGDSSEIASDLEGRQVSAYVEHRMYNGKTQCDLKYWQPADDSGSSGGSALFD